MADTPISVLLIEDSDDDADLVARGVARFNPNITLERAHTVPNAIGRLRVLETQGKLPTVVLVDGRVDGVDASTFFQELTQLGIRDLCCVVLTGCVDPANEQLLLASGAKAVRSKPVEYSQFLNEIALILQLFAVRKAVVTDLSAIQQRN